MFPPEYFQAIEAARRAGRIISHYYNGEYTIHQKGRDQPVTNADNEANEAIRSLLIGSFPKDAWLSEETQDDLIRLQSDRVWIVDPLDGTREFIRKTPEFAVSIALVEKGSPLVGVIYNPITDELFSACRGRGAFLNDQPIRVTGQASLKDAHILSSRSETERGEWKPFEGRFDIRQSGGMAYKMSQVAKGAADGSFSLSPKTEWDFCAGVLLVEEAGGTVTDLKGKPFAFNQKNTRIAGLIYGNPEIHRQLFAMLGSDPT